MKVAGLNAELDKLRKSLDFIQKEENTQTQANKIEFDNVTFIDKLGGNYIVNQIHSVILYARTSEYLSDEDKAEVVENKAKYSLEDIEAKLSVICVRKKVNFDLDDTSKNDNIVEEKEVMTYNISNNESTSIPAWISALKNTRDNRK